MQKHVYMYIEGSYRVVPIHGYIHVAQCPQAVPLYICNNIIVMEKEAGILWYVLVFGVDMLILLGQWLHRCVQRYTENGRIQKRNVRGRDWESTCFSCLTHMDDKNVANGRITEQTSHRYTHTHTYTSLLLKWKNVSTLDVTKVPKYTMSSLHFS